ncbi:MAG: hypothetical protein ACLU5J_03585 [Christensenellales bacterium]
MKWFEYIILIVAIGLVLLPFILKYSNKKRVNHLVDVNVAVVERIVL